MTPFSRKIPSLLPFLALIVFCTLLAGYWASRTRILIPDELSMVSPGVAHIFGQDPGPSKYPPAAPAYFEAWLRAANLFKGLEQGGPDFAFRVARVANLLLYAANLFLFFLAARLYLKSWALFLACGMFALNPVVFYSAVHVKTEGLLLGSILLCLMASARVSEHPARLFWHALAGAACALGAAAKYNGVLPAAYAAALLVSSPGNGHGPAPGRKRSLILGATLFLGFFLGGLTVMWPGFLHAGEQLGQYAKDLYFLPGPSMFTAMEGTGVFPYGRFSYPLLITIPFFMGPLVYLSAWAGIFTRALPGHVAWIWGLFSGLYLLVAFVVTRLQYPPAFLPVAPFLTLSAVALWQKLAGSRSKGARWAGRLLAGAALLVAVHQYPAMRNISNGVVEGMERARQYTEQHGGKNAELIMLLNSSLTKSQGLSSPRLREGILNRRPDFLLVLDSYLGNFSKQQDPEYRRQAGLWEELITGDAGYEVAWTLPIRYPLQWLNPDPESRMTLYFFQRKATAPNHG